jgi:hypothetical protein
VVFEPSREGQPLLGRPGVSRASGEKLRKQRVGAFLAEAGEHPPEPLGLRPRHQGQAGLIREVTQYGGTRVTIRQNIAHPGRIGGETVLALGGRFQGPGSQWAPRGMGAHGTGRQIGEVVQVPQDLPHARRAQADDGLGHRLEDYRPKIGEHRDDSGRDFKQRRGNRPDVGVQVVIAQRKSAGQMQLHDPVKRYILDKIGD